MKEQMKHFKVSKEAAEIRLKNLKKNLNYQQSLKWKFDNSFSYDDVILEKFKTFIDKISPKKFTYEYELERDIENERKRQSWI